MSGEKFKYDVAISFLKEDLQTAARINAELVPFLKVFFYADRQQDIAGTDGLETFRSAFRHESRLVVVLYRAKWGQTEWTGVESLS